MMGSDPIVGIADNDKQNKYTVAVTVPKHSNETHHQQRAFPVFQMNTFGFFVFLNIALILSVSCVHGKPYSAETQESVPLDTTVGTVKICQPATPCGWAVYIPFTRRVDYFMKNTCICPSDKSCVRYDDELSVSAYVYRCGEKQATTEETLRDVPTY